MRKAVALALVLALLSVSLAGCWSYTGLNEMALVMGMAIDKNFEEGIYRITCEIADLTKGSKDGGLSSKIVEAQGRSLFEAIRNAKRKLLNKLYFGNMGVVIFGEELARKEGIMGIIQLFMSDAEIRETVGLCVAYGGTGADLLTIDGLDQSIISIEISSIIAEDNSLTASTVDTRVYQVCDALFCPGLSPVLSAFRVVENDGERVAEAYGVAMFEEDKLVGFLTPEETRYFLFATDRMHGGIIVLPEYAPGTGDDASLEVEGSKTSTSFEIVDEKLVFHIETETTVYLSQVPGSYDVMDQKQLTLIETRAGEMLAGGIARLIADVQAQYRTDIFGFGKAVHRKDLAVWRQIESAWALMFPTVRVVVTSNVEIVNTGYTITRGVLTQ